MTIKKRINLAERLFRYHLLNMNAAYEMTQALMFFENNEQQMYEALFRWANARWQLDEWWDENRFDYLRMTEVVGGWK